MAKKNVWGKLDPPTNYGLSIPEVKEIIEDFLVEKSSLCGCNGWECECGGFAAGVLLDLMTERGEL